METVPSPSHTTNTYTDTRRTYGRLVRPDPPDWMRRCDLAILEFLFNERNDPLVASPAMVEANTTYSLSTIRQRMRVLERADLLAYYDDGRGLYELSELGSAFVNGTVTAADIADPDA